MGYIRPDFPKLTSRIPWLLIGGEHLRKSVGNRRKIFGNLRKIFGKGGQGKAKKSREGWVGEGQKKKEGGVGGGWPEKKAGRGGWVMTSSKK